MQDKVFENKEIGTIVLRKSGAARRISIRVHPERGVSVVLPSWAPYREGLRFFESKRDWILKTMKRQEERIRSAKEEGRAVVGLGHGSVVNTLISEIVFRRSDEINFGQPCAEVTTEVIEDVKVTQRAWLSLDKPMFRKTVCYSSNSPAEGSSELNASLQKVLVEVMRTETKNLLPAKLNFLASRYGFQYQRVTIKHNSSNWGSCSARGNINLNLNLIRLPDALCDCVILHELSHLRCLNHGPEFHALLEQLCADNLQRLILTGDPYAAELRTLAARSRSAMPVHSTMERELKKYKLI